MSVEDETRRLISELVTLVHHHNKRLVALEAAVCLDREEVDATCEWYDRMEDHLRWCMERHDWTWQDASPDSEQYCSGLVEHENLVRVSSMIPLDRALQIWLAFGANLSGVLDNRQST